MNYVFMDHLSHTAKDCFFNMMFIQISICRKGKKLSA